MQVFRTTTELNNRKLLITGIHTLPHTGTGPRTHTHTSLSSWQKTVLNYSGRWQVQSARAIDNYEHARELPERGKKLATYACTLHIFIINKCVHTRVCVSCVLCETSAYKQKWQPFVALFLAAGNCATEFTKRSCWKIIRMEMPQLNL